MIILIMDLKNITTMWIMLIDKITIIKKKVSTKFIIMENNNNNHNNSNNNNYKNYKNEFIRIKKYIEFEYFLFIFFFIYIIYIYIYIYIISIYGIFF
jgi:hypothetical protein